jgi:hypothetical protein
VPVQVVPFFPSCLVVPSVAEIDVSLLRSDATFWITPMAPEGLDLAHLEIVRAEKVLQRIPTPVVARRPGPVIRLVIAASLTLAGFTYGDRIGGWPGFEGQTIVGVAAGLVLLAVAAVWRWRGRSRPAEPRNGTFEID